MNQIFKKFLDDIPAARMGKTAFVEKIATVRNYSYRDFFQDVTNAHSILVEKKIVNKRIIFYAKNSYEWIVLSFACTLADNVLIPIHRIFSTNMIQKYSDYFEADLLVTDASDDSLMSMCHCKLTASLFAYSYSRSEHKVSIPSAVSHIFLSSGTMGSPKGVMHTTRSIVDAASETAYELPAIESTILVLPLAHIYAYNAVLLPSLIQGATIYISQGASLLLRELADFEPKALFAVPNIVYMICERLSRVRDSENNATQIVGRNLSLILSGGAALKNEFAPLLSQHGIELFNGYGSTEACGCISLSLCSHDENGCVGNLFPSAKAKVINRILWIASENMMTGYFGVNPDEVFVDGWFCTHDIGNVENNKVFIFGRDTDCSLVLENGEKIDAGYYRKQLLAIENVLDATVALKNGKLSASIEADLSNPNNAAVIRVAISELNRSFPSSGKIREVQLENQTRPIGATGWKNNLFVQ